MGSGATLWSPVSVQRKGCPEPEPRGGNEIPGKACLGTGTPPLRPEDTLPRLQAEGVLDGLGQPKRAISGQDRPVPGPQGFVVGYGAGAKVSSGHRVRQVNRNPASLAQLPPSPQIPLLGEGRDLAISGLASALSFLSHRRGLTWGFWLAR